MRIKPVGLSLLALVLTACLQPVEEVFVSESETWAAHPEPVRIEPLQAKANLSSEEGIEGTLNFMEDESGTSLSMNLTGLEPEQTYRLKIHRIGDCSSDYSLVGPPFYPEENSPEPSTESENGSETDAEAVDPITVGVLSELRSDENGLASLHTKIDPLMLSAGPWSIRHRSVIIHGTSTLRQRRREPSSPLACGLIDPVIP